MMPQRMVLSRRRGFDLQAESARINGLPARVVGRPSRWGNPFSVPDMQARFGLDAAAARAKAVELHRQWLEGTIEPALSPGERQHQTPFAPTWRAGTWPAGARWMTPAMPIPSCGLLTFSFTTSQSLRP